MVIHLFITESTHSSETQELIQLFYLKVLKLIKKPGVHRVDKGATRLTS